jgi:SAM-dependent methyltransferase
MEQRLEETLHRVAEFYDGKKVGDVGPLGFRRSTDLKILRKCADRLLDVGIIRPGETRFLDLGCADGRVNVFFSYLVKTSVGIELDEWTLDEYGPLRSDLERRLRALGLPLPPDNIHVFHGDSEDERTHCRVFRETGIPFGAFDLFYTYLVMHEEFARRIVRHGKSGAVFMVYGLQNIIPSYDGLRLLDRLSPMEGIMALYRKE